MVELYFFPYKIITEREREREKERERERERENHELPYL